MIARILSLASFSILLLTACGPSSQCAGSSILTGEVPAESLGDSRTAWAELKASLGGSYCYDRTTSYFSGERVESAVRVSNDRVISTSGELPALTMEQLYDRCEQEVLVQPRSANDVALTLADNGVLLQCYFVPQGCQDDCAQGIVIDHLTAEVR
jgi:hypothetical protein